MQLSSRLRSFLFSGKQRLKRTLQYFFFSALTRVSGNKESALLWTHSQFELSPAVLLSGFMQGFVVLPNMRNHKVVDWLDPKIRGVLSVDHFKMQDGLLKLLKKEKLRGIKEFEIKIDADFEATINACSKPRNKKAITWLSTGYIEAAVKLHKMGIAHSVEAYQNGRLVGGVIGIAINGYFMSLSLFHTVDNASKVAFYYLMLKLKADGFKLHDLGIPNPWIKQFGMQSIPREEFKEDLIKALTTPRNFTLGVPVLDFPFLSKTA